MSKTKAKIEMSIFEEPEKTFNRFYTSKNNFLLIISILLVFLLIFTMEVSFRTKGISLKEGYKSLIFFLPNILLIGLGLLYELRKNKRSRGLSVFYKLSIVLSLILDLSLYLYLK